MKRFPFIPSGRLAQEYQKNRRMMKAAALRILQEDDLAEDAVQTAWLNLCRAGPPPTMTPEQWRSYLLVTVHNAAVSLLRTRRKEVPVDVLPLDAPSDELEPEQQAEQREAYRRLYQALLALPRKNQDILLLKYDNGCTIEQIAALLALPPETVKKRLYRARQKLRQKWEGSNER